jgi:hypothetical protein
MKLKYDQIKGLLWILPGLVAFFIALIPSLTYQWPLTLDIFVHIHVAQVYSQYGFVLIDPLIDPPTGTPIAYPPLFSLILLFIHSLFKIDYFMAARILQPVLALSIVLSTSYVAKKFYGDIAGISAGFLILSSYLFGRILTPLPETMALIFEPLVVLLYYKAVMDKNYKYALISSLLFLIVILTHQATTLILLLIITSIAIILGILRRKIIYFTSYALFLSIPIIAAVLAVVFILLTAPNLVDQISTYGITAVTGYSSSLPVNESISDVKYAVYLGFVLILALIGLVLALKRREDKDLFVIIWIVVIFIMSKSYWLGINVYTIRLLVHLLLPLSILGGLGLSYLYLDYKKTEFTSKRIRSGFLIAIFVISSLFAMTTVLDPKFPAIPKYDVGNAQKANPQIVPPSNSDVDMANWFSQKGNKSRSVLITNIYSGKILLALTGQPIATINAMAPYYLDGTKTTSNITDKLKNTSIGYLVYDKRLKLNSTNQTSFVSYQNFVYYSTDIHDIIPTYARIVHENDNYIICEVSLP